MRDSIQSLWYTQVDLHPEKVAIESGDEQITYAGLDACSNLLAQNLLQQGVKKGDLIGIAVEDRIQFITLILGILKAGAVFVPVDGQIPELRLQAMLSGVDFRLVLADESLKPVVERVFASDENKSNGEVVKSVPPVSAMLHQAEVECLPRPQILSEPDDPVYIYFTSGSTGKPKGVVGRYKGLLHFIKWEIETFAITEEFRFSQLIAPGFDACLRDIFVPLCSGGTVCVPPPGILLHAQHLIDWVQESGIWLIHCVPGVFKIFLAGSLSAQSFPALCYILLSGERLHIPDLGRWFEMAGERIQLVNLYGLTETTMVKTFHRITRDDLARKSIPIGEAMKGARILVLDADLQVCERGAVGEIYIRTPYRSLGYYRDPELTAQKFIPNPLTGDPTDLLFQTGDLGRMLNDGSIELIGRKDQMVKVRGVRVELGDVEAQLLNIAGINDVVVIDRKNRDDETYLTAYYRSEQVWQPAELRKELAQYLPDAMIPAYFVRMERFPLLPNGKVDRKGFPAASEYEGERAMTAPRDEVEVKLAQIWMKVLGVEQVGVWDNFFDLGGHSLKVAQLAYEVVQEFQRDLPVREVFRTPTIAELAEYLRAIEEQVERQIPALEPQEYYPVSSVQKRLYVLQQMDNRSTGYNMPGAVFLKGELDLAAVQLAFQNLVQRHESLRTSFHVVNGEIVQRVHLDVDLKVRVRQGSTLPEVRTAWREVASAVETFDDPGNIVTQDAETLQTLLEPVLRDFLKPFELSCAPLLRVELIEVPGGWVLFYDMHHIISDGLSMGILVADFCRLLLGEELPALRIQYKDFAVWQNAYFESKEMQKQEQYWLATFSGELPVLNLPLDGPRPVMMSFAGDRVQVMAGTSLTDRLHQLAAGRGATLYMLLLAAYSILLAKYSGQEEVIVGSPVAGRRHADVEPVIGMFVNTLALRNRPERSKTFAQFLAEVRESAIQAFEHQDYPFELLVEKLELSRNLSRNPLFDTLLVLQNMDQPGRGMEGLQIIPLEVQRKLARFDLTLSAMEDAAGIHFTLEYRTDLFRRETVERLAGYWIHLLEQIAVKPETLLRDLDLLQPGERVMLMQGLTTPGDETPQKTIHQLVEEQVERTPDQIAVVWGEEKLTYRELNARANQLARKLRAKGVTPDTLVAILLERSPALITGILGVLKAGGAYLPIDPAAPRNRMEFMLTDSAAPLLLTQASLMDAVSFAGERIDLEEPGVYSGDPANLEPVNTPEDLAYVIYTSGTTGKPKGVMLEHQGVVNLKRHFTEDYGVSAADRVLQFASATFDVSVSEIFMALFTGATLYLVSREIINDLRRFEDYLNAHEITVLSVTPSYLNQLQALRIHSLRTLITGGAQTNPGLVNLWKERARYINAYGPTEATICTTAWCAPKEDIAEWSLIPVGRPIANMRIYLLDADLQFVPVGAVGEICISGMGVARGYLNRAELTAERFVTNPFRPDEQMYRTGDLARLLPDGNLEFVGRVDEQVKIRGFRIEPGEVESHLLRCTGVKDGTVVCGTDTEGEAYLVAYLVAETEIAPADLRRELTCDLPDYMLPAYYIQLDRLPLTPNGKVDRRALPSPTPANRMGRTYLAPVDAVEARLVAIWTEVLGVEQVGITDHFFELGGHSLKATTLIARINQEFQVNVPLREVFQLSTVQQLAHYIRQAEKHDYEAIQPLLEREFYPVSSAQKRLYILQQMEPESMGYNMPGVLRIRGSLDCARLEQACRGLVNRHESLRTSFHMQSGAIIQRVHPAVEFHVCWLEGGQTTANATKDGIAPHAADSCTVTVEKIRQRFLQPFDLSQAPLLRVGLVPLTGELLLLYDMHHIISDGVSMSLLIRDLFSLYEGTDLPELRVQYKDFAVWQNERFAAGQLAKQEEYWLTRFAGELPVLELPIDNPRPGTMSFAGSEVNFAVERDFTDRLLYLAQENGATLYMLLLAAFNVLLARYTGQQDIIIGSPIAGRPHADVEQIIGMFVNTLALRNQPRREQSFVSFLHEVRDHAVQAFENQEYPFEVLVEKLGIPRDLSRNPLFDVMFVLQNLDESALSLDGLELIPCPVEKQVARFDLTLCAVETANGLHFGLEYRSALFTWETIERIARHFVQLLHQIVDAPARALRELELLNAAEKEQLVLGFNATTTTVPCKTIHQLVEEQVERTPDAVAVVCGEQSLTYRELNEQANRLARVLGAKGVKRDSIVAILQERSLEMIISMLGVLKAGGAYLPLDLHHPRSRLEFMLQDSKASLVLSRPAYGDLITFDGEILDAQAAGLAEGDASNLQTGCRPDDLAYVIYTSGTTGEPKGVMLEHKGVVNLQRHFAEDYPVGVADRVLQFAACTFDVSVAEIYMALFSGASLYLVSRDLLNDLRGFEDYLNEQKITVLSVTPAYLNQLEVGRIHTLRTVVTGGLPMKRELLERWKDRVRYINAYGPTEATICATAWVLPEGETALSRIPIGKPLDNTHVYILDADMNLVPVGVLGELYIAGAGLARGYLERPELTRERFLPSPFCPGERIYRTGDLARWLSDGNLELMGRVDEQVKIRGYRIEPGEIEVHLLRCSGVKASVVVPRTVAGEAELVAYVVAEIGLAVAELRTELARELPDYMIPAHLVRLDQLPLTPHGKVDRRALPEPDQENRLGRAYVAPGNEVEEQLAAIWSKVLGIERVGAADHFFELGGHSLKATTLIAQVNQEWQVDLQLRQIFQCPALREQAALIVQAQKQVFRAIQPLEVREYYPVSSAQKRLYMVHQFDRQSTSYNMPGALWIDGELDEAALERAFLMLIARHESLRTSFHLIDGEIVQKVHPEVTFGIKWSVVECVEPASVVEQVIINFLEPFNLAEAPLLRVELCRVAGRALLLYDLHHIISDGQSMQILIREFLALYQGEILPPLRIQYRDFAAWQNAWLTSEAFLREEAYWLNLFRGEIPALQLPTDKARPAVPSDRGERISFSIEPEVVAALRQLVQAEGATLYMLLLAAYTILLARYSGQDEIIIGSPIAGRNHADVEQLIGLFINTLALRNYPGPKKTLGEFLTEVRENVLEALEHQEYPFELLVEKLELVRDLSRNPLFDTMLVLQNLQSSVERSTGVQFTPQALAGAVAKFDLTLTVVEEDAGLRCSFDYRTELWHSSTIGRMAKQFALLLPQLVGNAETLIGELEILTEEEKQQLLVDFNSPMAHYPVDCTLPQIFESQVRQVPDRIAVTLDGQQLTYQDLNARANQLARHLRAKGVQADTIVGLLAERSLELIIGIMGVLKAGGAYLPLDPTYPAERIEYMLQDSQIALLLRGAAGPVVEYAGEVLDLCDPDLYIGDTEDLSPLRGPEHLAYIIYTSGSTGRPKGVMIEHRNVVQLFFQDAFPFDFGPTDVWTLFHSPCFDFSVWEIFGALLYGGKLVIIPVHVAQNPAEYRAVLLRERVTVVNQTPTAFYNLSGIESQAPDASLCVRYVIFGGEALKPLLLKDWKEKYPETRLINMYGITETTVHVTFKPIEMAEIVGQISNVGKPLATLQVYIVDENLRPVPLGVPGELCVAGAGVARGYLNQPGLTARRFPENPFTPGQRLYRSGDLARWLQTGDLEYLGRIDRQVKIRGYRIELGEIENCLLCHPGIQGVAVVDRESADGEKYLVAYLVPQDSAIPRPERPTLPPVTELRAFLQKSIPEYMIPAYFVPLEQIPLTANGKVDRKALPELEVRRDEGVQCVLPATSLEMRLARLWSEILQVEPIGVTDNFFALGGHSLKATRIVARLQTEFGVQLSLKDFFQAPTIAELAKWIMAHEHARYEEIPRLPEQPFYELSFSQRRLWIINQLEPESAAYNMVSRVTLHERVDPGQIQRVFATLVERHESFRTIFPVHDGSPVQQILPSLALPFDYFDLSAASIADLPDEREVIYQRTATWSFDLKRGPLFRVVLVKVQDEEYDLIYTMHHIISDGWSMEILRREFVECYRAQQAHQEVTLPALPIQYRDFAAWQQQLLTQEEQMQDVLTFWAGQLTSGHEPLRLPYDAAAGNTAAMGSAGYRFVVPQEIHQRLQIIASEENASLFMILLAGFAIFQNRVTGQTDLMTGIPSAGREHESLKGVIGFFINTLVVRTQIAPTETFTAFLRQVQATTLKVLEYQSYPLEEICTRLQLEYPQITTFFNMLNFTEQGPQELENVDAVHLDEVQDVKFDLACYLVEQRNGIEVICSYRKGCFEAQTVEFMMQEYLGILAKIAENPARTQKEYVRVKERRKLL